MKAILTMLMVGLATLSIAQSSNDGKKFHTYLTTNNMGIYPKISGELNQKLIQNLKGIAVMEDKKTSADLKVTYFVFKYAPRGQNFREFPVEGSEFPPGIINKYFKNPQSGDKFVIEQVKISNSNAYKGSGSGVTVMEYTIK